MSEAVVTAASPYARIDVLLSEEQIAQRVREMGNQLSREYEGKQIGRAHV